MSSKRNSLSASSGCLWLSTRLSDQPPVRQDPSLFVPEALFAALAPADLTVGFQHLAFDAITNLSARFPSAL